MTTTVVTVKDPAQGMTVRIAPHLDPILLDTAMTVTVTALLESSMTVPVDTMMTVVTVGHPHRSDKDRGGQGGNRPVHCAVSRDTSAVTVKDPGRTMTA
jgi:hypothetical protein